MKQYLNIRLISPIKIAGTPITIMIISPVVMPEPELEHEFEEDVGIDMQSNIMLDNF